MKDKRAGSTIIYVLFIMLIVMILATTVTGIMLRNIKITKGYSQSARSYYASESGIERGLYYLQWARNEKIVGAQAATATINNFSETFSFNAEYDLNATVTDDALTTDLVQYESQQWDMFAENYTTGYHLTPLPDLDNIAISWNESSSCTASTSQVEVSFSSWTQFEWEDISDPDTIQTRYIVPCQVATDDFDCDGYALGVDNLHLYRVRIKALNCDIEDVTVTALNSVPAAIPTYNLVQLTSTGQFIDTQRVMNAQTLWHPPLQHYFDFVLFAEDQITK